MERLGLMDQLVYAVSDQKAASAVEGLSASCETAP